MQEISSAFGSQGLQPGFHTAAAELYGLLAGYKGTTAKPDAKEMAERVLAEVAKTEEGRGRL